MGIISKFKSLPISSRRLLSLGIIFGLVVALPLFIWAIINLTFDQRERASTGEPTAVPINWTTPYVSITADDFRVITNNSHVFTGGPNEVTIIPGTLSQNSTSIQIDSKSTLSTLKMIVEFRSSGSVWWVDKVKVFNSEYKNDWIEYNGPFIYTALGYQYSYNGPASFTLTDPDNGQLIADVHFTNLVVRGFANSTPPPTACPTVPFTINVFPASQTGVPGQTLRYSVLVTNNDPQCGPLHVSLSVDKPSNWIANFGTQNFILASNHTYYNHLDVTAPLHSYALGVQPITVRVNTVNVGNLNTKTVAYNLVASIPQVVSCNQTCNTTVNPPVGCTSGLSCLTTSGLRGASGVCRNLDCDSETDCTCPQTTVTPTPTATPTTAPIGGGEPNSCGGTCGSNYNCKANFFCYQGYCRNPLCASDSNCDCITSTATATSRATSRVTTKPRVTSTPSPKGGNVTSSPSYKILTTLTPDTLSLPEEVVSTEPENKFFTKYALPIFAVFALIVISTIYYAVKKNKEKIDVPHITPPVNL